MKSGLVSDGRKSHQHGSGTRSSVRAQLEKWPRKRREAAATHEMFSPTHRRTQRASRTIVSALPSG